MNPDAENFRLRGRGAFLVSSAIDRGIVQYADIVSEKGTRLRLYDPHPDRSVTVEQREPEIRCIQPDREDALIAFDTVPGGDVKFA
ncbi:MAG: hypothetical protein FJY97_04310 [candidate division Zixibacteria bacterium]|nr:hypothetical protein [candidate division Zixibacteria bacterium]